MRLSYDEIIEACDTYRDKCEKREFQRAQWEHFVGWVYEDPDELEELIAEYVDYVRSQKARKKDKGAEAGADGDAGAGAGAAVGSGSVGGSVGLACSAGSGGLDIKRLEAGAALKRLHAYIQGQLATSTYWGGALSAKAIFLLKQGNATGRGMKDKQETAVTGDVAVKVQFGGGLDDPFG